MSGGGLVRSQIERPDPAAVKALARFPTGIVSDCQNRLGALDGRVSALHPGRQFCGPAVTVEEVEGGNLMSHAALDVVQPGDVLVIDGKGVTTRASLGGVQVLMARERGVAGIVVYGMVRDAADIADLGLPVYALGTSPAGPLKGFGGNVNLPIACAGVAVSPGDVVIGDDDGVVVVARERVGEMASLCEAREALERGWEERVRGGEATIDILDLRRKADELGIEFE